MKKLLFIFASVVLLFAACAKEQVSSDVEGGLMKASFTATMDLGSKAVTDGQGANVNRCVMEIFYGADDKSYGRYVAKVTSGVATFSNIEVVANRTYKAAFWADCVLDASSDAGLGTDQYYDTQSLKAVSFKGTYAGNNDARDAFFGEKEWTPTPAEPNSSISIKRPFAQVNAIATDWASIKDGDLAPTHVNVVLNDVYTTINALDGSLSNVQDLTYSAAVYENPGYSVSEATLSMDYLLAATEKAVVDINWEANQGTAGAVSHTFSAVPYQRNYRTNIKGALLSLKGQWTVTVDPIWESTHTKIIEVADIKSANAAIAANTDSKILDVKFKSQPNDSGVPTGDPSSTSRAILTSPIAEGGTLSIEVETNTETLYVGDYQNEYNVSVMATSVNPAVVNINVPQDTKIGKLVVNAPSKSVHLNGKAIQNVGEFDEVDAITSQNTLVIEPNQLVKKLTIHQGGLEIHGTVNTLVIEETDHQNNPVKVRACENLSQSVFDVIFTDGSHDYIDRPAYDQKAKGTSPETWDIVPSVCQIGQVGYSSVEDAFAAVQNSETIVMLQNEVLAKGLTVATGDKQFTLDLNGKVISIAETGFDFSANGTNVALRSGVPLRFAIVVNGNGTMNICDGSAGALGKIDAQNYSYGTVKAILVDGNAVVNLNSGTVSAGYSPFYVVGYTGMTPVVDPSSVPKPTLNVNGGKVSANAGPGVAIKGNTAKLTVAGGVVESIDGDAVSTNGTIDWYDGGNSCITITGGSLKSTKGSAMYLPAKSPTIITGGLLEGACGIAVKGGTLTVSGDAVIKAKGAKADPTAAESGYTMTGSCIYVEDTYSDHKPVVNISGGKFSSDNNKTVEYYTTKVPEAADKGKVTLTGGLYAQKPADEYCAEICTVVESGDAAYPWKVQVDVQKAEVSIAKTGLPTEYMSLAAFRDATNEGNSFDGYTITLLKDIDLSGTDNFTPIGIDASHPFSGRFDGQNHTISCLSVSRTAEYAGLFGRVTGTTGNASYTAISDIVSGSTIDESKLAEANYSASIKNLTISSASISNTKKYSAVLVGEAVNCHISNITVNSSSVSGQKAEGLIAGTIQGTAVFNCITDNESSITSISGGYHQAGIVGATGYTGGSANAIVGCTNNASVGGYNQGGYTGGIVAYTNEAPLVMKNCTNNGEISLTTANVAQSVGGLVGRVQAVQSVLVSCQNTATLTASTSEGLGGIIGDKGESSSSFFNCSNSGNLSGSCGYMGGIVGKTDQGGSVLMDACYNTGTISNQKVGGQSSSYIASGEYVTYKNITFADETALSDAMPKSNLLTIDILDCTVTDKTGTFIVPPINMGSTSVRLLANTNICNNILPSAGLTTIVKLVIPGLNTTLSSEWNNLGLILSGDNQTVTVAGNTTLSQLTVGSGAQNTTGSATINGKINGYLTYQQSGTATISNGAKVAGLAIGPRDRAYHNIIVNNYGTIAAVNTGKNGHVLTTEYTLDNIVVNNHGTISVDNTNAAVGGYLLLSYGSKTFVLNNYQGAKLINNSPNGGYWISTTNGQTGENVTFDIYYEDVADFVSNGVPCSTCPIGSSVYQQCTLTVHGPAPIGNN